MSTTVLLPAFQDDQSMAEVIDFLYARANFDEHNIDAATSGLCGTFALALFQELTKLDIPAQLVLLCMKDPSGRPCYEKGHDGDIRHIYWRHAAVRVNGYYYDIEGRVELSDIIANYCWGIPGDGGMELPVSPGEFIKALRSVRSAYDGRYYVKWRRALSGEAHFVEPSPPLGLGATF